MSEQYFLQKCITTIEDAKGSYAMLAHLENNDFESKEMYNNMLKEIGNHLYYLNGRLKYLKNPNN